MVFPASRNVLWLPENFKGFCKPSHTVPVAIQTVTVVKILLYIKAAVKKIINSLKIAKIF